MELAQQEAALQRHLHLAVNRLLGLLREGKDLEEIKELAIARLRAGFAEFGDQGWRKTPYELLHDIREEIADCLVYLVMLILVEQAIAQEALGH